ncbi:MAG: hypothetical protein OEQ25_08550 [Gammaproteobacteria bacterium]|nr:hypothetical protein [Gammaproteobacteria bacterium]MDH3507175.1 hypothetical protein [Gammaproteobacteria bacterium]
MTSRKHLDSICDSFARRIGYQFSLCIALVFATVSTTFAGPTEREQAFRIHNRLAGVPPSETVLTAMEADLNGPNPDPIAAARTAMDNPNFYTVTVKNFAAPWTNRDQTVFVPLNDYTTLVIGMVKDGVPFTEILSADLLYRHTGQQGLPSPNSNAYYENLEQAMLQPGFDPQTEIVATTQSAAYGTPTQATAGVMTTRAAAEAFFIAGTNRAMFRFTLMNHMCTDLEGVHDTTIVPDRIRQDVSRSPGGDSRVFMNNCIGCHSGMDPLAQAFAYYDYDEVLGRMLYTGGTVASKYFNNDTTFEDGFITPDDSWNNYWRVGQNANLGWDINLPGNGAGAKTLGQELAATQAFAQCQVTKVFRNVCLRNPVDAPDRAVVATMTGNFTGAYGYDLKEVFAASAAYCMGN